MVSDWKWGHFCLDMYLLIVKSLLKQNLFPNAYIYCFHVVSLRLRIVLVVGKRIVFASHGLSLWRFVVINWLPWQLNERSNNFLLHCEATIVKGKSSVLTKPWKKQWNSKYILTINEANCNIILRNVLHYLDLPLPWAITYQLFSFGIHLPC